MKSKNNFKEKATAAGKTNLAIEIHRETINRAVERYLCNGGIITKLRKEQIYVEDKTTNDEDLTNNRFGYLSDCKFEI